MRYLLIAAIALLAAAPVTAQATQEFRSNVAGYTLQFPAAWRRMPDEQLNSVRQLTAQAGVTDPIEVGYRVTGVPNVSPVVTVITMDMGERLSRQQFRVEFTGAQTRADMQSAVDALAPGDMQTGVPVWDEENGVAWTRVGHKSQGEFMWTAAVLHPGGRQAIVITYLGAVGQDEARVRAHLLAIARSLKAD